ncbi:MAG: hypothetical protein JWQ16_2885 [Novosphingobium sp.]|nr:hypothetical protein [Novosphingobium sp.]
MRNGTATAMALAFCVMGCGERASPAPEANDLPTSAPPSRVVTTPATASVVPARLHALGTKPFWNAQISGGMLTYTTPEDHKGQRAALVRRDQANGAEYSGKLGEATIHIVVTKQPRSDGMSDRRYPFTVIFTLGGDRREGCAP